MISKEKFVMIHTLYTKGVSIRGIAHMLGINRRTVSKRLKKKDNEDKDKVRNND